MVESTTTTTTITTTGKGWLYAPKQREITVTNLLTAESTRISGCKNQLIKFHKHPLTPKTGKMWCFILSYKFIQLIQILPGNNNKKKKHNLFPKTNIDLKLVKYKY